MNRAFKRFRSRWQSWRLRFGLVQARSGVNAGLKIATLISQNGMIRKQKPRDGSGCSDDSMQVTARTQIGQNWADPDERARDCSSLIVKEADVYHAHTA